ncbi:Fc.00g064810.m01.CDS01 [Cosmosporella sp. VM-42]
MAPTIAPREANDGFMRSDITFIIIIVSVAIVSMAMMAFLISCIVRRRKAQKYEQAPNPNPNPYITKEQKAKQRKFSDLETMEEVEIQRQEMIYKSLATRASPRTLHHRHSEENDDNDDNVDTEVPRKSLRSEWKEWEANIQRDRSISLDSHPGLDLFGGSCSLLTPTPSRAGSPSRHPLVARNFMSPPPPTLHRIPDKRET